MAADDEADSIGVLDRMTAILEAFDEDDRGLRISELATRADLPKSTVSRLVTTLVRQRYLERDGNVIHLGLRLFELGQLADEPRELRGMALPIMADLRTRTDETVCLAIRDTHEMVCVAIMRGHDSVPVAFRVGGRFPAHATALGKAMLAHSSPTELDAIISAGVTACTPQTIVDPETLRCQLAGIRRSGLAAAVGELTAGVSCLAGAVFAPSGVPVAAISVSGRTGEFDPDRSESPVRAAALALTRRLASGGAARA